jgi:AcrR family transcriptional regulator
VAESVKRRRPYDASGRRAEAEQRRAGVLRAAHALFFDLGYAATTVPAVATRAAVSAETVYKTFGGKAGLVRAVREEALRGLGPVPAEVRSDDLRGLADARRVVRGWSRLATEVAPRVVPVLLLVRDAAVGDPSMRGLYDEMEVDRLTRMTENARFLADGGHLRPGVSLEAAADVMFAVSSPEMFEMLVLRRGWELERYGEFVATTLTEALLPQARS